MLSPISRELEGVQMNVPFTISPMLPGRDSGRSIIGEEVEIEFRRWIFKFVDELQA